MAEQEDHVAACLAPLADLIRDHHGTYPIVGRDLYSAPFSQHARPLINAVRGSAEFTPLVNGLARFYMGARAIDVDDIAVALFSMLAEGKAPKAAVVRVLSWPNVHTTTLEVFQSVYGLQPLNPVDLGGGLSFHSAEDASLPFQVSEAVQRSAVTGSMTIRGMLVCRLSADNPFEVDSEHTRRPSHWRGLDLRISEDLNRARHAQALAGRCPVQFGPTWSETPLTRALGFYDQMRTFEGSSNAWEPNLKEIGASAALYREILDFNQAKQPQLARLLERFSRSLLHFDPVDAHADLGVVAEGLLLNDLGSQPEITYRLKLRGAWLLGASIKERQALMRSWNTLYGHRSSAAHSGALKKEWTRADLDKSVELCARAFRKILDHGASLTSEEWTRLTLGGGLPKRT